MPSDQLLIQRMQEGDAEAFDALLERHASTVRRCILRIVKDDAAAEDLSQEVFLRLWTRAEQWQGHGALSAWLLRMATNLALNHLRSLRRRRQLPLEPEQLLHLTDDDEDDEDYAPGWMVDASALGADEIAAQSERRDYVRGLVDALPEQQRQVVRLVSESDMEIADVAEELGIPTGTAKSRLHYARLKLLRKLENDRSVPPQGESG